MADGTVQLNFNVPKKIADKVRADAVRNSKTIDAIGTVIIGDFFNAWNPSERARFYEQAKNKTTGRPTKNLKEKKS